MAIRYPANRTHRRAGVFGGALAIALVLLSVALLRWALTGVLAAGLHLVPVSQSLLYCAAGVAGLVALTLAWCCVLGSAHLLTGRAVPARGSGRRTASVAPRVAAVLVALAVGGHPADADVLLHVSPTPSVHREATSTSAPPSLREDPDPGPSGEPSTAPLSDPVLPLPETSPGDPSRVAALVPDWRSTTAEPSPRAVTADVTPTRDAREPVRTRTAPEGDETDVVVLRGDSLWGIAAAELGSGATPADIAARWPAWYAANRGTIGPDPDVILPGLILRQPATPFTHPMTGDLS